MQREYSLTPEDVAELGETLFGDAWRTRLAEAMNVPRQGVQHYLKAGIRGAQAAALVGVLARTLVDHQATELARRQEADATEKALRELYQRFSARLQPSQSNAVGDRQSP